MKTKKCKRCGTFIPPEAKICPNCGAKAPKNHTVLKFLLFVLFVFILFVIWPSNSGKQSQDNNISDSEENTNQQVYNQEINYGDYHWGDSVTQVSTSTGLQYFESMTPGWNDAYRLMVAPDYSLGYQIQGYGNGQFEGYGIANYSMYFAYQDEPYDASPENSKLYLVKFNLDTLDVESAYSDLCNKFKSNYGEGKTTNKTGNVVSTSDGYFETEIEYTEWHGQNDTGALVCKCVPKEGSPDSADNFERYVVVSFGKTNSDELLSNLYKLYKDNAIKQ